MMTLPSYFKQFRSALEPPPEVTKTQQRAHIALRAALAGDAAFGPMFVNAFLQGSYKRRTAIAPGKDVDIVVVTSIDPDVPGSWRDANQRLGEVLARLYGAASVKPQTRSYCVTTEGIWLDVVVAASQHLSTTVRLAARTAEEIEDLTAWLPHPLLIPDVDLARWVRTDPKAQLEFTTSLNKQSNERFVPLVKMFKSWRKNAYSEPKYPKGYLLERVAADCFDPNSPSDAEAFAALLVGIQSRYRSHRLLGTVPHLSDPGVNEHNVLGRLAPPDFTTFYDRVSAAADVARQALRADDQDAAARSWYQLFGSPFPAPGTFIAAFPNAPIVPNQPAGFA